MLGASKVCIMSVTRRPWPSLPWQVAQANCPDIPPAMLLPEGPPWYVIACPEASLAVNYIRSPFEPKLLPSAEPARFPTTPQPARASKVIKPTTANKLVFIMRSNPSYVAPATTTRDRKELLAPVAG